MFDKVIRKMLTPTKVFIYILKACMIVYIIIVFVPLAILIHNLRWVGRGAEEHRPASLHSQ